MIEHASIICEGLPIRADDLPDKLSNKPFAKSNVVAAGLTLREIEMEAIHTALEQTGGNKTAAAQQLGVSLKTLYNKLNQEAIRRAA